MEIIELKLNRFIRFILVLLGDNDIGSNIIYRYNYYSCITEKNMFWEIKNFL